MLTATNERDGGSAVAAFQRERSLTGDNPAKETTPGAGRSLVARVLRVEWLGQTIASLCWIASVFAYGITSTGDWLQLGAASAWFVANLAAVAASESG